jgi:3-oxoadipate enol-lactonase
MQVAAESALESLATRILALRKLTGASASPLRLPLGTRQLAVLNRIAAGVGSRGFGRYDETHVHKPTSFEGIALAYLALDRACEALLDDEALEDADLATLAGRVVANSLEGGFSRVEVATPDNVVLNAFAGGVRGGSPVVVIPACGMPIELSEAWLRELGRTHYVVTWETRGLFGHCAAFEGIGHGVAAQAADAFAVMDHFELASAHLMGLCGGAVVVLAAASERPDRAASISLWYGDYDLGDRAPKTKHQRDLVRLLVMIRKSRGDAAALQRLFQDPSAIGTVRAEIAHLVLYPYVDAELLYRYATLNGAIMETDVYPMLARITGPALVVTSDDDDTAHPEGSRLVAGGIAGARLHVAAHGDHLSLFDAPPNLAALATDFIAGRVGSSR